MKRLLVLMLVLGMASVASAGIVLSVNGDTTVDSITLSASEYITIDILLEGSGGPVDPITGLPTDGSTLFAGGDLKVDVRDGWGGTLDSSGIEFPSLHTTIDDVGQFAKFSTVTGTFSTGLGIWENAGSLAASTSTSATMTWGNLYQNAIGGFILVDQLIFHATELGDVTIDLIAADAIVYFDWIVVGDEFLGYSVSPDNMYTTYASGALIDTITILSGVPEPMTVLLLGLGGLFLRRRK